MFVETKKEGEMQQAADLWSLPRLIAWLEKQPTDKTYCYGNIGECLHAKYLKACGWGDPVVGGFTAWDRAIPFPRPEHVIPRSFIDVVVYDPNTFGAALERARALAHR